jgi:hypothetical protein
MHQSSVIATAASRGKRVTQKYGSEIDTIAFGEL